MSQKILQSLLPKKLPEIGNSRVAFLYVPMMGIGGDFISILQEPETGKLGLFICDVSGHGLPAAMTAAMISMALDTHWKTHIDEPAKVLTNMRGQLKGKMGGNFFTASLCTLHRDTGIMGIASAGHPPLVIIRKDGHVEMVRTVGRLINEYFDPGLVENNITLKDGDRLILYTDGLIEAESPGLEMLGMNDANFCSWLKEIADRTSSPTELCQELFTGILDYAETIILDDDLTILVLEYMR
jgi:two-component system, sensor histidine kinase LadS